MTKKSFEALFYTIKQKVSEFISKLSCIFAKKKLTKKKKKKCFAAFSLKNKQMAQNYFEAYFTLCELSLKEITSCTSFQPSCE